MWQIPVYAHEKKDGIADLVRANASIAYTLPIRPLSKDKWESALSVFQSTSGSANQGQFDLFYLDTILVTTGWNKNDDIFLKEPTWEARTSAEDKPFNFGHNQLDIIGHITANQVVDEEYKSIAHDSVLDDVPDKFHILTGAVIYKAWADKKQQERIDKIIAEILEDKWCVSMECLFKGFNYGVETADGSRRVIARDENTSFLTKHLRTYGGTGKYNDYKIGRVLSNITFSGKGLVENPANPDSIIFNNASTFKTVFVDLGYINFNDVSLTTSENKVMADTTVDEYKATIAKLEKKLEDHAATAKKEHEEKLDEEKKKRAEAESKVEEEKKKRKEAEDKAEAAEKDKKEAEKKADEKEKEAKAAKDGEEASKKTMDEYKKASKVEKAGASEDEAKAFISEWGDLPVEKFEKLLAQVAPSFEKNKTVADSGSLPPPAGTKKVSTFKPGNDDGAQDVNNNKGGKNAKTGGNTVADVLDDVQPSAAGIAYATTVVDESVEASRAAMGEFLSKKMSQTKSRKRV